MRRVAIRGLLARKLRLTLTALSIALGVTLMSATYVFTDTISGSFDAIFGASYEQTDVVVAPDTDLQSDSGAAPIPGEVLRRVQRVEGVKRAEGVVFWPGLIARKADGGKLKGRGLNAVNTVPESQSEAVEYVSGGRPANDNEVSIFKSTADTEGLKVGDRLLLGGVTPARPYRISGVYKLAGVESFGGGVIATFTLPEGQRVAGFGDAVSEIDVVAEDGVPAGELRSRVAAELKDVPKLQIRTGKEQAAASLEQINDDFLGVIRTALLAFAGIALFVGAFLIFNTFSITVAQRAREFALLRVLGATRVQILREVLLEGFILGVLGSMIGTALGVGFAKLLRWLFKIYGADLPSAGTVVEPRTITVSLVVGITITLLSTIAPALRATRVAPLQALIGGLSRDHGPSRWSGLAGGALTAAGLAAMAYGLFAGLDAKPALSWLGAGAGATFIGVALLSPRLVRPIAGGLGAPLARLGIAGRLARENSIRQPARTATTAAALMIGVALVVFASVFAAGIGKTIRDAVENSFTGHAVIQADAGGPPQPVSPKATAAIGEIEGVTSVAATRFGRARLGEETVAVSGVDPAQFGKVYDLEWKQGDASTLSGLAADEILVAKDFAEERGIEVGTVLELETQREDAVSLTVAGITDDKAGLVGDLTVSNEAIANRFGVGDDAFVMAAIEGNEERRQQVREQIERELKAGFPGLKVESNEEFVEDQEKQVGQLLSMIYLLLGLSIIVSLFGIVNTLILSISERVREIGLLRAVGMSRRQIRQMIRYEAVITALIGATLGIVLGIVLAVLVTRAIDDFALAIPVATLVALFIVAAVAGVLAAVLPARRAAKLDVLESLAYE